MRNFGYFFFFCMRLSSFRFSDFMLTPEKTTSNPAIRSLCSDRDSVSAFPHYYVYNISDWRTKVVVVELTERFCSLITKKLVLWSLQFIGSILNRVKINIISSILITKNLQLICNSVLYACLCDVYKYFDVNKYVFFLLKNYWSSSFCRPYCLNEV